MNKKIISIFIFILIGIGFFGYYQYNNIQQEKIKKLQKIEKEKAQKRKKEELLKKEEFLKEEKRKIFNTPVPLKIENKINILENKKINKNIYLKDNSNLFFRNGDKIEIQASIYNNTKNNLELNIVFYSKDIKVKNTTKKVFINANSKLNIHFWTEKINNKQKNINYSISVIGKNKILYDKIEKNLENKQFPLLVKKIVNGTISQLNKVKHFKVDISPNTDYLKSKVKVSFSTNPLDGLVFFDIKKKNIKQNNNIKKEDIEKNIKNFENLDINKKIQITQGLLDFNYEKKIVDKYINILYNIDWSNYYFSDFTKNNAYKLFEKYTNKYGKYNLSNFAFSLGYIQNRNKRFWIGGRNPTILKRDFILDDIIQYKENFIEFTSFVLSGKNIFCNFILELHPKDKLKIKAISNKMNISSKIYKLENNQEIRELNFEKNKLYKIVVNLNFLDTKERNNIVLESYIPSGFEIQNSNNNIANLYFDEKNNFKQNNKLEIFKDKLIINIEKYYGKKIKLEYIVKAKNRGEYFFPPADSFIKDKLNINSIGIYKKIIIK